MSRRSFYIGVGARCTPPKVLKHMEHLAFQLAQRNYLLQSGGAKGADSAFERGCDKGKGDKKIYTAHSPIPLWAYEEAKKIHPNWKALSPFGKKLMARNSLILQNPGNQITYIFLWTPEGKEVGGTGQIMRLCNFHGYNWINLFDHPDYSITSRPLR